MFNSETSNVLERQMLVILSSTLELNKMFGFFPENVRHSINFYLSVHKRTDSCVCASTVEVHVDSLGGCVFSPWNALKHWRKPSGSSASVKCVSGLIVLLFDAMRKQFPV